MSQAAGEEVVVGETSQEEVEERSRRIRGSRREVCGGRAAARETVIQTVIHSLAVHVSSSAAAALIVTDSGGKISKNEDGQPESRD